MKKLLTAIAAACFLIYPCVVSASYVIHLKDGREFVTDRYWEEGGQIKFKRYGGVIGIQNDQVKGIEEKEDLPENEGNEDETQATREKETPGKRGETEAKSKEVEKTQGSEKTEKTAAEKEGITKGTEKAKDTGQVKEEEKRKAEQEKAAKIEAILEEKRRIIAERDKISSAFKKAKASNDSGKKDAYWNKLLLLQKELAGLRERVKAEHSGKLPYWWDDLR
jgi:hypothetical protein